MQKFFKNFCPHPIIHTFFRFVRKKLRNNYVNFLWMRSQAISIGFIPSYKQPAFFQFSEPKCKSFSKILPSPYIPHFFHFKRDFFWKYFIPLLIIIFRAFWGIFFCVFIECLQNKFLPSSIYIFCPINTLHYAGKWKYLLNSFHGERTKWLKRNWLEMFSAKMRARFELCKMKKRSSRHAFQKLQGTLCPCGEKENDQVSVSDLVGFGCWVLWCCYYGQDWDWWMRRKD